MDGIQFIERNGEREYAVVPMGLFQHLLQVSGSVEGIVPQNGAASGNDVPVVPDEIAGALFEGVHPVKAWRRYRSMTQRALAGEVEISKSLLARIESGKPVGTIAMLTVLAHALKVPVNYLVQ